MKASTNFYRFYNNVYNKPYTLKLPKQFLLHEVHEEQERVYFCSNQN